MNRKKYTVSVLDDMTDELAKLIAIDNSWDPDTADEESGAPFGRGSLEEEGLRCIDHYNEHAERMPDVSFVPDGYFPMVNCEKGLVDFDLKYAPGSSDNLSQGRTRT